MTDKEYEEALAIVEKRKATRVPELLAQRDTLVGQIQTIDVELAKLNVVIPGSVATASNGKASVVPTGLLDTPEGVAMVAKVKAALSVKDDKGSGTTVTAAQFDDITGLTAKGEMAKAKAVRDAMRDAGIIEVKAKAAGAQTYIWLKGLPMGVPVAKK